jgi:glycosyltransferase involved in cell wall biosynthesis
MVVVEAMARMKRVVATKCGGPEEIITDGDDGFLVDKENPEAMSNKLEELIKYSEKSNHVPVAAFNTAKSNYSLPAVASNLMSIISSL